MPSITTKTSLMAAKSPRACRKGRRRGCLGMPRIKTDDRKALSRQRMGEPYRCRPTLEANSHDVGRVLAD
jgi:hypothetical protein